MKEPEHRERTFATATFGRFVRKHGILMEINPVNPLRLVEDPYVEKARTFIFGLHKGGKSYSGIVTFDRDWETMPAVEDILEYMANVIATYRHFKDNIAGYIELMNVAPQSARVRFEELAEIDAEWQKFLGPDAYDELMKVCE